METRAIANPPRCITQYQYRGETVYYVIKQCCNQFNDLLNADGNLIGHPEGGINGSGNEVTVFDPTGPKGKKV